MRALKNIRTLAMVAWVAMFAALGNAESRPADVCVPGDITSAMPSSASEYASLCREHVGVIPTIDCGNGVPIPIRVDGEVVFEDPGPGQCDNSDFKGNCRVGSRIGRVQGTDVVGTPLPDVVWVYFCRSAGKELFEEGIVSVQMIGHNTETGAACFFESP